MKVKIYRNDEFDPYSGFETSYICVDEVTHDLIVETGGTRFVLGNIDKDNVTRIELSIKEN